MASFADLLSATDATAIQAYVVERALHEPTPLKRIGRPEEMAEMALFLLSERSSFTTGQVVVASGGRVTLP